MVECTSGRDAVVLPEACFKAKFTLAPSELTVQANAETCNVLYMPESKHNTLDISSHASSVPHAMRHACFTNMHPLQLHTGLCGILLHTL